ncbi:MAG: methyltransferase domain-containing protein, partial [Bryobacteraceae bacterium]
ARGKRALDAGCGAGYGSAELARAAQSVVGIDCAADAIEFASANYRAPNLTFEQASCGALPYADSSFDLIVAFEVIEHLPDWRQFLQEARRALAPNGQFIVSTPNKLYYGESRGAEGENPFHVHEFEFAEFRDELRNVFPHVSLFLENHVEGVTFRPHEAGNTAEVRVDPGDAVPEESHFFVAVCAHRPQLGNPTFVYIPRAGNVLRERERHIGLLERELEQKNGWLETAKNALAALQREHEKQTEELDKSNRWAEELNAEVAARGARVVALQGELAGEQERARAVAEGYAAKVAALEDEIREKTQWAIDVETSLKADVARQTAELVRAVEALHHTEKELDSRTVWAHSLDAELRGAQNRLAVYRESRWVKLGRKVGLGPAFPAS